MTYVLKFSDGETRTISNKRAELVKKAIAEKVEHFTLGEDLYTTRFVSRVYKVKDVERGSQLFLEAPGGNVVSKETKEKLDKKYLNK
jgi:hypothetical protein